MTSYPKYKNSGIEWIGEIPVDWAPVRLKYIAHIKYGLGQPPRPKEDGLPIIRATNVERGKIVEKDLVFVDPDDIPYDRDPVLRENDIIVVRSGAYTADSGIIPAKFDGAITGYDMVVRATNGIPQFLAYCLLSTYVLDNQLIPNSLRAAQPHLNREELGEAALAWPSSEEQKAIAAFLDDKTTKIDRLLQSKRRQIALLKEERTALINQAVTRGLDPEVPLKDSGVEWIGKIPKHWEVKKLKFLSKILRGKFSHRPRNDERLYGGNYPFVQTGDVSRSGRYLKEFSQTLNNLGREVTAEFPKGTLVMTIAATVAEVAILDFDACFPDSIVGFLPSQSIGNEFLYQKLVSLRAKFISEAIMNTQLNLNIERIGEVEISFPSVEEQAEIVQYIDSQEARILRTSDLLIKEIDLLQEYRTALISEVVTGKIRVS